MSKGMGFRYNNQRQIGPAVPPNIAHQIASQLPHPSHGFPAHMGGLRGLYR